MSKRKLDEIPYIELTPAIEREIENTNKNIELASDILEFLEVPIFDYVKVEDLGDSKQYTYYDCYSTIIKQIVVKGSTIKSKQPYENNEKLLNDLYGTPT